MRHQKKRLKLNRDQDHKQSLQRNLVTQLLLHEKIKTTARKADFAVPMVEKLLGNIRSQDTQQAIRTLKRYINNEVASRKTIEVYKERYKDRQGGFTRTIKLGVRKGDNASLVVLELVS